MDKILIVLKIPSLDEKYDVYVPKKLQINRLIMILAKSINEITNGRYVVSSQEFLCYEKCNVVLDMNSVLAAYNIKNGDTLVLI